MAAAVLEQCGLQPKAPAARDALVRPCASVDLDAAPSVAPWLNDLPQSGQRWELRRCACGGAG